MHIIFETKHPKINIFALDFQDFEFDPDIYIDDRKIEGKERLRWVYWFQKGINDYVWGRTQ